MGRYATVGGNLQVLEDLNFPSDSYLDSMSDVVCTHKVVKYVALLGLSVTRILLGGGVSVSDTYRIWIRPGYTSDTFLAIS